ncbi:TPA: hypothetical protein L9L57_004778 [Klebsiella pneumoniae]|nr:hypothetical protein [Klebsiella pneumoniae]HBR1478032.1 hypothetical protein [Klebsiella pneumoniae]
MRNGIFREFSVNFLSIFVFYTCIPEHVLAASIWEKYTSSSAEDMWVLRIKPQMDMAGIVFAPFFDVNKRGRLMSYADSFGNKFQFDATIKNIYINCKKRQYALYSTEFYRNNNLLFKRNDKIMADNLSSHMGFDTLWRPLGFGDFYSKSFEYYCNK